MKKLGLILFAFMAMCVCAVAQPQGERRQGGPRPGGMPRMNKEQMVKRMTDRQVKRLKLNEEQTAKMKVLNDSLMSTMMSNPGQGQRNAPRREVSREEREAQRKAMDTRMSEARAKYNKGVKAILTPEQFKEFEKMEKERPQMGQGREGRRGQGERGGQGGPRDFGGRDR